jgi:hypothetical protein
MNLAEAVQELSEVISAGRDGEGVLRKYESFVAACLRQTDNIKPRLERLKVLYKNAF